MRAMFACSTALLLTGCSTMNNQSTPTTPTTPTTQTSPTPASTPGGASRNDASGLQLGNFSVSLAVKDLAASRAFYETLGFKAIGGDASQNWLILQNETATIGLFQGMFEKNILTFNPGWDRDARTVPGFTDVRELQATLEARGVPFVSKADAASNGPASFIVVDPDGNPILVDQHVPRPEKP